MRLKPKKRLGQNFLVNKSLRLKVLDACGFAPQDIVVELGAGRGEMTGELAARVKRVIALELDRGCLNAAYEALSGFKNIELINQDILKFDFKKHFGRNKVKVFGNIPYYISTPIIERLIEFRGSIKEAFLTLQREFARRLAAQSGSREFGRLSCFVQYYSRPQIIMSIKPGSFFPAPKVSSALVKLAMRKEPAVKVRDEKFFFQLIRAAFGQRRKALRNSLKGLIAADNLENIRPEQLSLAQFADLSNQYA